jgi:hypothetical protein
LGERGIGREKRKWKQGMQPNDVLIQASSYADAADEWHVVHRSAGPIGAQAWIQALSVARRIARAEKLDVYRAEAGSGPTLFESYRPQ